MKYLEMHWLHKNGGRINHHGAKTHPRITPPSDSLPKTMMYHMFPQVCIYIYIHGVHRYIHIYIYICVCTYISIYIYIPIYIYLPITYYLYVYCSTREDHGLPDVGHQDGDHLPDVHRGSEDQRAELLDLRVDTPPARATGVARS